MNNEIQSEKIDQCYHEIQLQCAACNSACEWAMSFEKGTEQRRDAMGEYLLEVKKMDNLKRRLASFKGMKTTNEYPADQVTFPRDSGTDILNNLDRRPSAIVDYWTENGRIEVIIRNEVN